MAVTWSTFEHNRDMSFDVDAVAINHKRLVLPVLHGIECRTVEKHVTF